MSSVRMRFEALRRQGLSDRDAMLGTIDHFNKQPFEDRDRYHERIKKLEADNVELRRQIATKETAW